MNHGRSGAYRSLEMRQCLADEAGHSRQLRTNNAAGKMRSSMAKKDRTAWHPSVALRSPVSIQFWTSKLHSVRVQNAAPASPTVTKPG
jgi:hypothetical protein